MSANFIGYIVSGLIILVALIVGLYAQVRVSATYQKYSQVPTKSGVTGLELANGIIAATGGNAKVRIIKGTLTDNYNPINRTVNISAENAEISTIAGVGVAAHEMGHYLQHTKNYFPFKVRQTVVKISNFTSGLLIPLLLVGMMLNIFMFTAAGYIGDIFIWVAVGIYGASALANLATLPVEIDASRRAVKMLKGMEVLDEQELAGTKQVLTAAALTYVASLLVSLGYFLRLLFYAFLLRDN